MCFGLILPKPTFSCEETIMTYRDLNDLFFKTWADEHGIIRGKPVMLIYRVNRMAEKDGPDTLVDEAFLSAELKKVGLSLCLD